MTPSWADTVAAADPGLVLPSGGRRADVEVPGPLALLDLLDLGDGHAVGVVRSADGARRTVPLTRDGAGARRSRPGDMTAAGLVRRLALRPGSAGGFGLGAFPVDASDVDASGVDASGVEAVQGERGIAVDQTNESVIVGERAVVKWSVRLPRDGEPGSPAAQRIAALVAGGFSDMPTPWGLLTHGDRTPVLLATVVEFLPGALDGWDWAVDDVRRLARGELSMAEALAPVSHLAAATARMHVAFAAGGRTPATREAVVAWEARLRADLDEAVRLVPGDEGARLRAWAPRIAAAYEAVRGGEGTPLVDVHGDLHVGQVLRHDGGYAVTDFDGNPVLPPAERAARQPAAVDVAGMTASLDHVGRVVLFRTHDVDTRVVRAWIARARAAFLHSYRDTLAGLRATDLLDERLLTPLGLAQEVREHLYAVRHLPHWVYVPDMALADLLPED